ncbi:hypothetical protein CDAR_576731 [Caerostris darwini]|uniref:Uncharacterized protein n=1 Tax=Caerostris darwini TaxID=1538125 RepID=A0AAV4WLP5_9ARAC|nr:hypothetical protein CDAR_576731 [Caerostris darwini]
MTALQTPPFSPESSFLKGKTSVATCIIVVIGHSSVNGASPGAVSERVIWLDPIASLLGQSICLFVSLHIVVAWDPLQWDLSFLLSSCSGFWRSATSSPSRMDGEHMVVVRLQVVYAE